MKVKLGTLRARGHEHSRKFTEAIHVGVVALDNLGVTHSLFALIM